MHKSQEYLSTSFLPANCSTSNAVNLVLNRAQAYALSGHLDNDSRSYLFSSILSLSDAISGLNKCLWSWSTVKLYYSVFYALRAFLAANNYCIFYIGSKPMGLLSQAGSSPTRLEGTTHKVVLARFSNLNAHHFILSQEIDLINPFDWLMARREEANYKNARFWEPLAPAHFSKIESVGLRPLIKGYCGSDYILYLFDKDHAMLAYPLYVIREVVTLLKTKGTSLYEDDIKYLKSFLCDKSGPLPELHNLLS